MSEYADIRVGVAPLVEGVDKHRRSGRDISSDDQPARLLKVRLEPRKESDQGACVEDTLAANALDTQWLRREIAVDHAQRAGLELAENGPSRRLDPEGTGLELVESPRRECDVDGYVESLVLARGQPALKILGVRQCACQKRISRPRVMLEETRGPHVDQLPLQVVDDPCDRQRRDMPRKPQLQAGGQEPEKPAGIQLCSGQPFDIPRAAVPACVQVAVGQLLAEAGLVVGRSYLERHTNLPQRRLEVLGMSFGGDQGGLESMRGWRLSHLIDKGHIRPAHVIEVNWRHRSEIGGAGAWHHFDQNLQGTVQAVEQAAERVDPTRAVGLRGAGKTQGSGLDHGNAGRSLPQCRRCPRDDPDQSEVQVRHHCRAVNVSAGPADDGSPKRWRPVIRGHRALQVTRWVLAMNSPRSTAQMSAGVPLQRPQDTTAPTPNTNNAAAARNAMGPHDDDQSANPASRAMTT